MSDLIRREDVIEALYQAIRTTLTDTFADSMSLAIAMANNLPFVEPEERMAKVVNQHKLSGKITIILGDTDVGECGNCGKPVVKNMNRYCHNCGCKLEWK